MCAPLRDTDGALARHRAARAGWGAHREAAKCLEANTIKEEEETFRCNLCSKRFKGPDFTHKHLSLKHPDELATATAEVCRGEIWERATRRPR